MTMSDVGIHQGHDGVEDLLQSLPSSQEGEIDSNEEERSTVEPQVQAEEDTRNSGGLRSRKIKSSRPEDFVRHPRELRNGKKNSSRPGRKRHHGRVKRDLLRFGIDKQILTVSFSVLVEFLAVVCVSQVIRLVFVLLLVLCSSSFPGELYQHVDSRDLHQKVLEIRIVETPLHSFWSGAQDGTGVFKKARHDFLLLRTAADKWYKAEKDGPLSGLAGIHFKPVTGPDHEAGTIRFRSIISVDFSLAQALDIVTDHKLAYSLWGENCWKYAHSRAEAILNSCIQIASDDDSVRVELKKELQNLMGARRPMPNEVVDVDRDWNIIWVVSVCIPGIYGCLWFGLGKSLVTRPSFLYELVAVESTLIVLLYMGVRNPILTYDLTGLATTYRWPLNFLSFIGYCVGWTLSFRGVESLILETMNHSEDPILRTAVSERGPLGIYPQDDPLEDGRDYNRVSGLIILFSMTTFELTIGYSVGMVFLRHWMGGVLIATVKLFLVPTSENGENNMRYIRPFWERARLHQKKKQFPG